MLNDCAAGAVEGAMQGSSIFILIVLERDRLIFVFIVLFDLRRVSIFPKTA
jgi:hypothetical protein